MLAAKVVSVEELVVTVTAPAAELVSVAPGSPDSGPTATLLPTRSSVAVLARVRLPVAAPRAVGFAARRVAALLTIVPPLYVLAPESVSVPPVTVRATVWLPAPSVLWIFPANVPVPPGPVRG